MQNLLNEGNVQTGIGKWDQTHVTVLTCVETRHTDSCLNGELSTRVMGVQKLD